MGRPTREEQAKRNESGRSTRVPLGVARTKLGFPKREGYVRRVVNDDEGRLAMALNGGYEFVKNEGGEHLGDQDIDNVNRDLGSRVSRVVNKSTGQKAYLMEIKEEFYEADQAAKRKAVKAKDDLIKTGKLDDDADRYIPDRGKGISIETRK
jgi:hypothetical protein